MNDAMRVAASTLQQLHEAAVNVATFKVRFSAAGDDVW